MITPWFTEDVQRRVADTTRARRESLALDLEVLAGSALPSLLAGDQRSWLARRLIDLTVGALEGSVDDAALGEVERLADGSMSLRDVFTLVRLAERCVESEMALDAQIGATSEYWPAVIERLRRASFDLLACYCSRRAASTRADARDAIVSSEIFELALDKELQRAVRYHRPVSLILFDVDARAEIGAEHGRGVAELVLERVGVFMRTYFRQIDWVGRRGQQSIAVLLPETGEREAEQLAEGARSAVEQRLVFPDRNDRPVTVTVSGTVVGISVGGAHNPTIVPLDAPLVIAEAESAIRRAKAAGGNRIEHVELARPSWSVTEAAAHLHCTATTVRRLMAAGTLPGIQAGGRVRLDRYAVEAYGKRAGRSESR